MYDLAHLSERMAWYGTVIDAKRDAAGTHYRRNRAYDPQTGRFTQEDPIGLAGGVNLYGYAGGDPANFSDPFGLCPVCEAGKIVVRGAASAGAASAADGPLPIGDIVGAAILVGSIYDASQHLIESSRQKPQVFHRLVGADEAALVQRSGELWGAAPRNIYASDNPQVKAYTGPLPAGAKGIEFTTPVNPDRGTAPGRARWTGPRPGVRVEGDYAKIPVTLTKNTTR